eukprot:s379_g46.t1
MLRIEYQLDHCLQLLAQVSWCLSHGVEPGCTVRSGLLDCHCLNSGTNSTLVQITALQVGWDSCYSLSNDVDCISLERRFFKADWKSRQQDHIQTELKECIENCWSPAIGPKGLWPSSFHVGALPVKQPSPQLRCRHYTST